MTAEKIYKMGLCLTKSNHSGLNFNYNFWLNDGKFKRVNMGWITILFFESHVENIKKLREIENLDSFEKWSNFKEGQISLLDMSINIAEYDTENNPL